MAFRESYQEWFFSLDTEFLQAITDKRLWLFTLIVSFFGVFLASDYDPVSQYFKLHKQWVLVLLGLLALCAVFVSSTSLKKRLNWTVNATLLLLTSLVFQMFTWSIVVYSAFPSATVLATFPVLLASYHGMFFQTSRESPYGAIAVLFAIFFSLFISRNSPHHLAIVSLVGPLSLGAAFIMGGVEKKRILLKKEHDLLRSAVDAQIMLETIKKADENSRIIETMKGSNHDACNTLSSILMNMQTLSLEVSQQSTSSINEIFGDISQSVDQLKRIIETSRDSAPPKKERVNIVEVFETSVKEFHAGYLGMTVNIHKDGFPNPFSINLHGGESTLNRIILNVLINAQQGNGIHVGDNVDIHLNASSQSTEITLSFADNGPGFSENQLACTIDNLHTTKKKGSGIGLYTVEKLVEANNGTITRYNLPAGGAGIDIVLNRQSLL